MPAPPIELILIVVLNCGLCQNAGFLGALADFNSRVALTSCRNVWKGERGDIENLYASYPRYLHVFVVEPQGSFRPRPLRQQNRVGEKTFQTELPFT
jgi:hypothetical protein